MALFDFMKKKKDDDFGDLGTDFGAEPAFPGAGAPGGMPGVPDTTAFGTGAPGAMPGTPSGQPFGAPPGGAPLFTEGQTPPPPGAPLMTPTTVSFQPQAQPSSGMDTRAISDMLRSQMDIISTKIDSLKAAMDRINERLEYIEKYVIGRR